MLQNSTISAIIRRVLRLVFIDLALFFVLEYNCKKRAAHRNRFQKTRRIFYDERNPEQKKKRIRKT